METTKLGRYELISRIGQGGMAEVRLALQRGPAGFEKLVVVKLINEKLAEEKRFVNMLLDEARMAALVKHPNVVDIYDLGEVDGRYFIAMEYLEGEPLLALLRAGRDGKRLDPMSTARLIADTAEGLDAAHELRTLAGDPLELVHHDVSLGNIVVLYNGQVKLVDFGVARATQQAGPLRVHGKSGYMAPEKLRGVAGDRRTDIWSLGVVMWEALTLKRLFRGADERETFRMVLQDAIPLPSQANPDVPPDFDAIVLKALERDPDQRYATAKQLSMDIEDVLAANQYGRRNRIAEYMQTTFAAHIVARRNLMREVSTKGTASAEAIGAVFHEAEGFSIPGELSIRFKRPTQRISQRMLVTEIPKAEGTPIQDVDVRAKRTTDMNLAEGTPHSQLTPLPKRNSEKFPVERTPGVTTDEIPAVITSSPPRADTGPVRSFRDTVPTTALRADMPRGDTIVEESTREATPAELDHLKRRSALQDAIAEEVTPIGEEEASVPIEMRPRLEPLPAPTPVTEPVDENLPIEQRNFWLPVTIIIVVAAAICAGLYFY